MTNRRARGYPITGGRRRICVTFDPDTFESVQQRATQAGVSFCEEAQTLVEWALEAIERWEGEAAEDAA